jgi:uncharacterized membrane protein YgaE (UPF0421/DUF939 family)
MCAPHRFQELSLRSGMDRKRLYFVLMGNCIGLIVIAWFVVRFFSTPLAIAMSVVAMVIPPIAAMIGNRN